ncbi:hypothetical protein CZ765_02465 [Corynebacterium casei]|nr:hypothetical protein CZ765_02465 [Corynebacterium casei]
MALCGDGVRSAVCRGIVGYLFWKELETVVGKAQPDVAV